ncbi:hypothetical protein R3P38DRAFT_2805569 [Favolaschia claudopus]|uniref:Uncharacterized protein n=1 Tax=Favolaschia claudopus TaxID=2862362 RepID=A0AAV9ZMS7_9AGAR
MDLNFSVNEFYVVIFSYERESNSSKFSVNFRYSKAFVAGDSVRMVYVGACPIRQEPTTGLAHEPNIKVPSENVDCPKGVRAGEAGTPGREGGALGWFKTEISITKHHGEGSHQVGGWFPEKGL